MESRENLVRALIGFDGPLNDILEQLGRYGWDSREKLGVLRRSDALVVLKRFSEGHLSAAEVEQWANAVEGRDDVAYEADAEDALRGLIFELANPALTRALTAETAVEWQRAIAAGRSPSGVERA